MGVLPLSRDEVFPFEKSRGVGVGWCSLVVEPAGPWVITWWLLDGFYEVGVVVVIVVASRATEC